MRHLIRVVRYPGKPVEVTVDGKPVHYVRGSFGYPDRNVTEVLYDDDETVEEASS